MDLLINNTKRYGPKFAGTDTAELFIENLKIMPEEWHYRLKTITYSRNKFGYRGPEFEGVNWNNSIIVLGCSNVFGIGVAEDETLPYFIQNNTGITTVNMGIAASSIYHSYYNIMSIIEAGNTPIAIVHVYSALDRLLYFYPKSHVSIGHWVTANEDKNDHNYKLYTSWNLHESNTLSQAKLIQRTLRLLCKYVNYIECSYFKTSAELLNIKLLDSIDFARDLVHPGRLSNKNAADIITAELS